MDSIAAFARAFRYRGGSIFAPWRNVSREEKPAGDCQDFAWSVLSLATEGKPLRAMLTGRAMIWRAHSPVNRFIPRHAVLWLKGRGWIDSTTREWRASPMPHKLRWPVGLPILALVLCAAPPLPKSNAPGLPMPSPGWPQTMTKRPALPR
jgi:hypothetical protein